MWDEDRLQEGCDRYHRLKEDGHLNKIGGRIMPTVYAKEEGVIIWSDLNRAHKAGRVPRYEPLTVLNSYKNWYRISRPDDISLPPDPLYDDYWVHNTDVLMGLPDPILPDPTPDPVPGNISIDDVAQAIFVVLRWLKQ